jgi:hypothetical protein
MGKAISLLSLIAVLLLAGSPVDSAVTTREIVDLNDTWLYTYSASESLPPAAGWQEVEIPSFVVWNANRPYIWFKRSFTLPASFPRERVYLRFQGVKYASEVYLNGMPLGEHQDGFTPFELAVPTWALQSNNELRVRVSDVRSALAPEVAGRALGDLWDLENTLIYPVGSQHYRLGIWQDVQLIAYPEVRIENVLVQTSVRGQKITLEVTLENLTPQPRTVTLAGEVRDGDEVVLRFPFAQISLAPRERRTVSLEQEWHDPRLWSPDDPYLYELQVSLSSGDEQSVRFGFREFWVEGSEFYLNGQRIHLRATSAHPFAFSKEDALRYLRVAKEGNNVIMRLHAQPWPSWWYEAADEVGMLIVWESAYWTYGRGYRVGDERFWRYFREHLRDQILLHRNHPSIVIWSLENELLLTGGARPDDPRLRATEAKLAELVDFVKALDPTRPIMFEGDGDPGGKADIVNLHYPHEYPRWNLWPNEAWWLEFTNKTDIYPGEIAGWPLEKPLYIGEFLWVPPRSIEGPSIFFGDEIYRDLWGYYQQGKATAWAYQIEAYRALGVQGFCPWNIWEGADERPNPLFYELAKEKFAPNGLYLREKNARFFEGDKIQRTAYLFNDLLEDAALTVTWELKINNHAVQSGSRSFALEPAEIAQFAIEPEAPQVEEERAATLRYRVERAGETVFSYEEPIRLYPYRPLQTEATIYLYDPAGTTASVLESEGIAYRPLADLSTIPSDAEVLIVARDGLEGSDDWRTLEEFAAQGGRVLVLHQERYPQGTLLKLGSGGATIAFPRRPSHHVLEGVDESELRFWTPDHLVIDKPLTKPDVGLYRVLIDAGSARGLSYVGLLELEFESGTILLSQLELLPKLDQEPAARKLFQNIIDYLAEYPPKPGRPFRLLIATPEEKRAFQAIGFDLEDLERAPVGSDALVFASGELDRTQLAEQLAEVERGGVLWLHKPSAAVLQMLRDLRLEVAAQIPPPGLVRVADEPEAEGLTSYSLFWAESQPRRGWELPPLAHDFAEVVFGVEADFSDAVEIPPEAFTVVSELSDVRPDRIALYANGYLETEIELEEAGRYHIGLLAQGTPAAGEFPAVRVQLGGETLGVVTVGEEKKIYHLSAELPSGRHLLGLEFFNDYYAPPEDRNLYFYGLFIAPATEEAGLIALTEPPALAKLPYGSGFILLDGLNWETPGAQARKQEFLASLLVGLGVKLEPPSVYLTLEAEEMEIAAGTLISKSEDGVWFATNGTIAAEIEFPEDGRYLFKVLAGGTPLDGGYPQFELAIDGQVIGRQSLTTEALSYYFTEAEVSAGLHEIALSFINDAYAPPEDRNLFVDRITIIMKRL